MRLELLGNLTELSLRVPSRMIDLVMLGLYLLLLGYVFYRHRSHLQGPFGRNGRLLLFLRLIALLLPLVLCLRTPAEGLAWAGLIADDAEIAIPLLAAIPVAVAAVWMGMAPAALVGLSTGLAYALSMQLTWTQALEGAVFGLALGFLLQQRGRNLLSSLLRQPLFATPLVMLVLWPIPLYAFLADPGLWSKDLWTLVTLLKLQLPTFISALVAGGVAHLLLLFTPRSRRGTRPISGIGPAQQSVAAKMLAQLVPMNLVVALVAVVLLNVITINVAFQRTLDGMQQSGRLVSEQLVVLHAQAFSAADRLTTQGRFAYLPEAQWASAVTALSENAAPFQSLLVLDRNARVISGDTGLMLTEAEITAWDHALARAEPVHSTLFRLQGDEPILSYVYPIFDSSSGHVIGTLIGRLPLSQSRDIHKVMGTVAGPSTFDWAYIIDERGLEVLGSGSPRSLETWVANPAPLRRFETTVGQSYEEARADGRVQLVYWLQLEGPAWFLILERERGTILAEAGRMAGLPLLLLAGLFALLTTLTVITVRTQLHGLGRLAEAAGRVARGELATIGPAILDRTDEIGELGRAIQQVTLGLGSGVEELARLVEVSQNISARSNLSQTLQVLLRAARRGLGARSAGIHLISADGLVRTAAQEGKAEMPADAELYLEQLSRQCWRTAGQVVVGNVGERLTGRARHLLLRADLQAMIIMPMLRDGRTIGTLWLEWTHSREFSRTDLCYVAALANLAGIMIDNSRIYRAVENERGRLFAILNSTRDGILVADADGKMQMANPAIEDLLGFDAREALGKSLPEIINSTPLFRMLADVARGRGPTTIELEHAGRRLFVSASLIESSSIYGSQGWVLVARDVTDMKRLDAMKADFVSTITHNMKSPLTYVRGYASMLHTVGEVNDRQEVYVERILKGIDDLTQLIDELTELGQISNRVGLAMAPVNLVHIVKEVTEAQRGYAEAKGLTFSTDYAPHVSDILGDARWLRHAVRNLVDNAVKYTSASGRVKVALHNQPDDLVVSVADSGVGISQADCRRIFEQFYRVRRKETLHIHGTGLGLSLVKKVAEQHGGRVWVQSELNVGSVFYLSIPKQRRLADVLDEDDPFNSRAARRSLVTEDVMGSSALHHARPSSYSAGAGTRGYSSPKHLV